MAPTAISIRTDLRQPSSPGEIIVSATLSAFGPHIDILINNAGYEIETPITKITAEDFSYVYDLKRSRSLSPLRRSRSSPPLLPRILLVKSGAGGSDACGVLAAELGGHMVNVVHPGPVRTVMLDEIPQWLVEWQRESTLVEHRLGTLDDVVQIVAFLAEGEE
ncbi:hypothetical protein DTO217A2_1260 [Paecilomyces variotii]|nr:hypothetical protein DTO217A2_1260 [Paecilomyces variotii]KAJ9375136.1 hypothetical protein DTO282E5_120 [Paecilomyces variotii]